MTTDRSLAVRLLALSVCAAPPIVAAAGMLAALPQHAVAQAAAVEPYYAAVAADQALLRSGELDKYYPVAKLKPGQVLRVDGHADGWARVGYPAGLWAFVPADAVTIDRARATATVNTPTRLKAANISFGLRGSWKPLLDEPLPPGSVLTLADPAEDDDGRAQAYRILAPAPARAFIQRSLLRPATQDEINAFLAAAPARDPAPPAPRTDPIPSPAQTTGAAPALADPPTVIDQVPTADGPDDPEAPIDDGAATYEQLEKAFQTIRAQTGLDDEVNELIAEYQRALEAVEDSPTAAPLRARIQQRIDILRLKADIQAHKRRLAEAARSIDADGERLAAHLADFERTRQYVIVGRLSASTLYDGERLPLMYRVQSVGGASPRTLGYLRPDPELKLDFKLGQVVGVAGDAAFDDALRMNIVTPRRIDILEPAPARLATPGAD